MGGHIMKKILVAATIIFLFATAAFAVPLPPYTQLTIDQGVGSDINVPCSAGSCFGMEFNGYFPWVDIGPGFDMGLTACLDQIPGNQTTYPSGNNDGSLTAAWSLFNLWGTFFTDGSIFNVFDSASCIGAECIGKTELGNWGMAWNGNIIPLGSVLGCLANTPTACMGVIEWTLNPSPATFDSNSTYTLKYQWAVDNGDISGFGNVKFLLILRGIVYLSAPIPIDLCANVGCPNATNCKNASTCNAETGLCGPVVNKPNGTACNDGNPCTSNDICTDGRCAGSGVCVESVSVTIPGATFSDVRALFPAATLNQ